MIVWGYRERNWIVKAPPDRFTALFSAESKPELIAAEINKRLNA